MQITKTEYSFSGSPAEFKAVEHLFTPASPSIHIKGADADATPASPDVSAAAMTSANGAEGKLTAAAVEDFLKRRPFSPNQTQLLKAVFNAGEEGITTSEICGVTQLDPGSVKALLRLLGKRVAHTPSWPKNLECFDRTWEGLENRYRLHKEVRDAIAAGAIKI